jgi:hypothetical protein
MAGTLVQTRVHLAHVVLFRPLSKRNEREWLRVQIRVGTEDIKDNTGGRPIVATSDNHTVVNDEQELPLIDGLPQTRVAFRVTRDLTNHELLVVLWCPL